MENHGDRSDRDRNASSLHRARDAWRRTASDTSNAGFMRSMGVVLDVGDTMVRELRDGLHAGEFTGEDMAKTLIAGGGRLASGQDADTVGETVVMGLMERWINIHLAPGDHDEDWEWLLSGNHPRIFPLLAQAADITSRVPRGEIMIGSEVWRNGPTPEQPIYVALALSLGMNPDATPDDMILVEWMKGRVHPDMLTAIRSIGGLDHAPDLPAMMLVTQRPDSAFGPVMRDVAFHRATRSAEPPDSAMMYDVLEEQIADTASLDRMSALSTIGVWADSMLAPHELRMRGPGLFPPSDIARESAYLRISRLMSLLDPDHVRALVESGAGPMIAPFSEAWRLLDEGMPEPFVVETLAAAVSGAAYRPRT